MNQVGFYELGIIVCPETIRHYGNLRKPYINEDRIKIVDVFEKKIMVTGNFAERAALRRKKKSFGRIDTRFHLIFCL